MEIYKVNNINDFLKEGKTSATEIIGLKGTIENYINSYFSPSLNLSLDMKFNIIVQENYKAIFFDKLAFLNPLGRLLDVDKSCVSDEELPEFLRVRIQNRLNELSLIHREDELIIKFPTLSGIYHTKRDHIEKSVALEYSCNSIKPSNQGDFIKGKRLQELGITRTEHANNLIEAYSFNFQSFLNTCLTDLERIVRYLDFLATNVSQAMMPVTLMQSLDEKLMDEYIKGIKEDQKNKGL